MYQTTMSCNGTWGGGILTLHNALEAEKKRKCIWLTSQGRVHTSDHSSDPSYPAAGLHRHDLVSLYFNSCSQWRKETPLPIRCQTWQRARQLFRLRAGA